MPKTASSASIGALALATLLGAGAAQAASPFTLAGLTDSGPLSGEVLIGSFAYDAAVLTSDFSGDLPLTRFTLQFAGQHYSLASADAAPAATFADGVFLGLSYADADSTDTAMRPHVAFVPGFLAFEGDAYFAYVATGEAGGFGSYGVSTVPEPASLALLLAGLGLLSATRRRRA